MIVVFVFVLFLFTKVHLVQALPTLETGYNWNMVWNDEFEGSIIDQNKWRVLGDEVRRDGWWVKSGSTVDQGNLILSTKFNLINNRYESGAVDSFGKFEHKFGYYEAKIKFAKKVGHWGAFWLHTWWVSTVGNEGKDGTEIDIAEKPWTNDHIQQTLHWDGYGADHKFEVNSIDWLGISDGFHVFGLEWNPDEYIFYIDGKESWRTKGGGVSQVPEFIMLTDEVGTWIGNINKNELPDYMYVDYVRVYDKIKNGDVNNDGKVNLLDFSVWKSEYLGLITTRLADFNKDGEVNLLDFCLWKIEYLIN